MNIGFGLRTAAIGLAFASLAGAAFASGSVNATANSSVTVFSPVSLAKTQDLAFGQVTRPSNANPNTVTIDANNNVTISGAGDGAVIASPTTSAKFLLTAPA